MTGNTVFAIDQHISWRGASTPPQSGLLRRLTKFSSACRLVLKYLLADGSLHIEFQKDCLLISGRGRRTVVNPLETETRDRALTLAVHPPA
jgi:hypothetical protein